MIGVPVPVSYTHLNFGIYLKSSHDEIHPKEVQKLLTKIEGTPEEPLISRLTLRSMKPVSYTHLDVYKRQLWMFFVIETNKRVSIERRFKNLWKIIYLKKCQFQRHI